MAKKTIAELLQEAKLLKQKEVELKAQMKAQKAVIAVEYADNLSPEAKAQQIADAKRILNTAKQKVFDLKAGFKAAMKKVREEVSFANEILEFVNYKQNYSLPKHKNIFALEGKILTFQREGIKDIAIDVTKTDWQKTLKEELKKQGINGNDRVADNICYKATRLVKSNITI